MNTQLVRTTTLLLLAAGALYPQSQNVEDAIAAGGCLACGGSMLLLPIVFLAINVALLIWVARDSKARGMDNSVVWVLLVLFTSFIGLIIYLFSRTPGTLIPCSSCANKRLDTSARCPHCGNA